jgi:hypothetical protein
MWDVLNLKSMVTQKFQLNTVEFMAQHRNDEKEALYILKKIRYYAALSRQYKTKYNANKLEHWEAKADKLLRGIPLSVGELNPTKNFKSLMQRYSEGELSYRENIGR